MGKARVISKVFSTYEVAYGQFINFFRSGIFLARTQMVCYKRRYMLLLGLPTR